MAITEVDVLELATALSAGGRLIDVREIDEYQDGHVPGAQLVVLANVPDNVDQFAGSGPTYVICRSGARSMQACRYLDESGFHVINVAGGTLAWIASGREVVSGAQPT